jgi:O-antigen/teichoic acid export membrane protein
MAMTRTTIDGRRHAALAIYRGASDIAAKGAMFLITVLAARRLSREDFGLFALASTFGWLGSVAGDFGIQMHLARAVSQHPDASVALLRRWLPVRITTGTASVVLSLAVLAALGLGSAAVPMVIFTLAYACTGLSECLYYFFRGLDRTDLESTLTLVQRGVMCLLAGAVLSWTPALLPLAIAMLLPAVATFAIAAVLARGVAAAASAASPAVVPVTFREFSAAVAPIGVGLVLSALYFRVDLFLIERWSGPAAVGLYNAVFRVVDALRLFPAAILAVALPALCRAGDTRTVVRLAAPLTAGGIGVAAVLWLAASWVVDALYGPAYAGAVDAFRTLALALPLMALNYALTSQLIGWHGHRAYALICGIALAVNVALNWHLIPAAGIAGAAWATVWTEAALTIGCVGALAQVPRSRPEAELASAVSAQVR